MALADSDPLKPNEMKREPLASPSGALQADDAMLADYARHVNEADRLFAGLVERHGGMVYQTCLRIVGDSATADDATQATFLVLAKKARQVRGDVGAFLHGVAVNVSRRALDADRLRKLREREAAEHRERQHAGQSLDYPGNDTPTAAQAWAELEPYLDESLEKLPPRQREALVMHYLEGRTQDDVATRMGLSRGTVAKHVQLGLEKLRRRLTQRGGAVTRGASVAMLAGRMAQFPAESNCPTFLMQQSPALSAAGFAKGGAGLAPQVIQMGQGVMRMMMWAKLKAAATVAAASLVLSVGIVAALEMTPPDVAPKPPVVAPGEKPGETSGGNPAQAVLELDGLRFEPAITEPVWILPAQQGLVQIRPRCQVTNTTKTDIYFNRLGFTFELVDPAGNTLRTVPWSDVQHPGPREEEVKDYTLLKAGETQTIDWELGTPPSYPELGALYLRYLPKGQPWTISETGVAHLRYFPVDEPGSYQLRIKYAQTNALPTVVDINTGVKRQIVAWKGAIKAPLMPVELRVGAEATIAQAGPADSGILDPQLDGCWVIQTAARMENLKTQWAATKLDKQLFEKLGAVDFSKDMVLCIGRGKTTADRFLLSALSTNVAKCMLTYRLNKTAVALQNGHAWQFTAVVVPKSATIEVTSETADPKMPKEGWAGALTVKAKHFTCDALGGDVVDGLQGCLEVKNQTLQAGDDITLHMVLHGADAKQTESIYVWDNKYSNGYRNDAYLVTTPDGTTTLLRRAEQKAWDKNAPMAVEILPGTNWKLGGWANDPIQKSMHEFGLDTKTPGTYTIVGLYMQNGGPATAGGMGGANAVAVAMWAGQIATPAVKITVLAVAKQE